MKQDFMLSSDLAKRLYAQVKDLPIIDYHNHISIADVADDRKFENITQLWIRVDPYKHRAMRILGVPERYITGEASDYEIFEKWYECIPKLVGNVLYDWSVMEFSYVFGIELPPFQKSAKEVWEEVNGKLKGLSARKILEKFDIVYCAPCATLTEDLSPFASVKGMAPSLRGDDIVNPSKGFVEKLSQITEMEIGNLQAFEKAIAKRLLDFKEQACRYTDHALDDGFDFVPDDGKNPLRFARIIGGDVLDPADQLHISSYMLKALAQQYAKLGLNMQLHIGAKRTTSTRLRQVAGPAGGYAAIGRCVNVRALTDLLDDIEKGTYGLPKTLLFTLNPADNAVVSVLSGAYSKDGVEAIVSQGPAWWWCDHCQGMADMLEHFSVYSVMSTFVGMTTDSRSLLSFVRHDYFRRILCSWVAQKAQKGIITDHEKLLSQIIKNMCYYNAQKTIGEES